ncbi:6-phosphogluconolactonase [bacterium]|nr:MAG: 6-phosphogluconolactonase [bacterium]
MEYKTLDISTNPVEKLATRLKEVAGEAIAARGRFSFALSGGSTPKALYELLASPQWVGDFDWTKIDILFGDERAVAPDDALSNFKMANEALLSHVPARVFRMEGEREDLEQAAADYETQVRSLGGPVDVVLLGLGDDGHTASLFPATPQLHATGLIAAAPVAPMQPHVRRLTFTYELINGAREVWFLAAGAGKADRLKEVLEGPEDIEKLPSQGVKPVNGELTWFIDEAAAQKLSTR